MDKLNELFTEWIGLILCSWILLPPVCQTRKLKMSNVNC